MKHKVIIVVDENDACKLEDFLNLGWIILRADAQNVSVSMGNRNAYVPLSGGITYILQKEKD